MMKILIAEDDTTSRLLFSATLRKLGYAVTAVENGQKAWEAWKQDEYPLLISDWMMPDIDGLELCRMIRAEPSLQYTYVILLTRWTARAATLKAWTQGPMISSPSLSMKSSWPPGCVLPNEYWHCIKRCTRRLPMTA